MASTNQVIGSVVSLWRYPIKSMQGEELNATSLTERGLAGDRAFARIAAADGNDRPPAGTLSPREVRGAALSSERRRAARVGRKELSGGCLGRPLDRHRGRGSPERHPSLWPLCDDNPSPGRSPRGPGNPTHG